MGCDPLGWITTPPKPLLVVVVFDTVKVGSGAPGTTLPVVIQIPLLVKLRITQSAIVTLAAVLYCIPLDPVPAPSINKPRRLTASLAPALIVMAVAPLMAEMPEKP